MQPKSGVIRDTSPQIRTILYMLYTITEKKAVKMAEIRMLSCSIILFVGLFFALRRNITEHNFVNLPKHFKFYGDVQAVLCKKTMRKNTACQKIKPSFNILYTACTVLVTTV